MSNKIVKHVDIVKDVDKLHLKSTVVEGISLNVLDTIDKLNSFMEQNKRSQGVAAIQVGSNLRICVVRINDVLYTMINPKMCFKFGLQLSNEGCESLGDKRYLLWRPAFGVVSYYDKKLSKCKLLLNKKYVRVVSHEIDHMNGIVISDNGREYIA